MLLVLWYLQCNVLVIVSMDEGKLFITIQLLVSEGLCIPDTVTRILILLFIICNDTSSVMGPTRVAISC